MDERWRVPLPRGAEPPLRVFVNGVAQTEGEDYDLDGRELLFNRPLKMERLGFWRWTAIFFALFGTYGKNDTIDVAWEVDGKPRVAHALDIEKPG